MLVSKFNAVQIKTLVIAIWCAAFPVILSGCASRDAPDAYSESVRLAALPDPASQAQAQSLLDAAAQSGNPAAIAALGDEYYQGRRVVRDFVVARVLYEQAARAGDPSAMLKLARLQTLGLGQARDLVNAYAWYEVAISVQPNLSSRSDPYIERQALYRQLTAEQRDRGKALARAYFEQIRRAKQ